MQLFNKFGYYGRAAFGAIAKEHQLAQPTVDYSWRMRRLNSFFAKYTMFLSAYEFECQSNTIIDSLRSSEALSGLLNGVQLPICLPQLPLKYYGTFRNWLCGNSSDYGTLFSKLFLSAAERSYRGMFPERQFVNKLKQRLTNQLDITPESRHQHLVNHMFVRPLTGVYFPHALYDLSASQARFVVERLPAHVLLAGGLDVATAMTAYPEVLGRDVMTPELAMSALTWKPNKELVVSLKNGEDARGKNMLCLRAGVHAQRDIALPGLLVVDPAIACW